MKQNNALFVIYCYTDHGVDALREREELDESWYQVESQQSRAQSAGVSCSSETQNTMEQTTLIC